MLMRASVHHVNSSGCEEYASIVSVRLATTASIPATALDLHRIQIGGRDLWSTVLDGSRRAELAWDEMTLTIDGDRYDVPKGTGVVSVVADGESKGPCRYFGTAEHV